MKRILDLDRFPLDDLTSTDGQALVAACRRDLAAHGLFNLEGFVRPQVLAQCITEVAPLFETAAFTHERSHNIYFKDDIPGLAADHPALRHFKTVNQTLCADQIADSLVCRIYEWPPLVDFLAAVMEKTRLYLMDDPLARANVMAYRDGEALNWHFDRSEFTTTLLLQSPEAGGEFQYRRDLRSESDPNYNGVGRLLAGQDREVRTLPLAPGTLNVFKGRYAAHRVTPVAGARARMIAVFSYYEKSGILFSEEEQRGFYGRASA